MFFLIVQVHNSDFLFADAGNVDRLLLFASRIKHPMIIAEVNESKPIETQVTPINEPDILIPAGFVQLYEIISIETIKNHNACIIRNSTVARWGT